MQQFRKSRLIFAAVLYGMCILNNLFSFLNVELGFLIMTPFRMVLLLTTAVCLYFLWAERSLINRIKRNKLLCAVTAFFAIWGLYGILWIFLGQTGGIAKTEVMGVLSIGLLCFCSFVLIRTKEELEAMLKLCVAIGLLLAVSSHAEAIFGNYIQGTRNYYTVAEKLKMKRIFFSPTSVFYNQNDFAAFLLLNYALVCGWLVRAKSKKEIIRLIAAAVVLASPTPLIGSTIFDLAAGLLTAATVVMLLLFQGDRKKQIRKCAVLLLAAVIFGSVLSGAIQKTSLALNRAYFMTKVEIDPDTSLPEQTIPEDIIIDSGLVDKLESAQASRGTIYIRYRLITAGLELFQQTPFTGYGPGGYRMQLSQNEETLAQTRGITDPHCFYIELLSQYGGVLFLAYVAIVLYCFIVLLRRTVRELKMGVADSAPSLLLLVAFSIAVMMPSSVLRLSTVWILFVLCVISAKKTSR